MTQRYRLEPEVPGELSGGTILDRTTHPPRVVTLEISFEGWVGDPLLEVFPCFFVTQEFRAAIEAANLTGCRFERFTYGFGEGVPDRMRKTSFWHLIAGSDAALDFAVDAKGYLLVSAAVVALLQQFGATAYDATLVDVEC